MRAGFLCVSVLRVASGPRVGLAGSRGALPPPRWFALLTVLGRWSRCWSCSLLLCGLFCGAVCCVSFRVSFFFLCFSVLLVLRLSRLGKRERVLVLLVRLFWFVLVWVCRFPLALGVWEVLRFVIVALPGLFSYLFFNSNIERMGINNRSTVNRNPFIRFGTTKYCIRV